jgi:hypothetical protein
VIKGRTLYPAWRWAGMHRPTGGVREISWAGGAAAGSSGGAAVQGAPTRP